MTKVTSHQIHTFDLNQQGQAQSLPVNPAVVASSKTTQVVCTERLQEVGIPPSLRYQTRETVCLRKVNKRMRAPSCSNLTASIDVERKGTAYEFQPVLEAKIDHCVFLIFILIGATHQLGCPTLLGETVAQLVIGFDGMQGLHSCLTPNPYVFCNPPEMLAKLKSIADQYISQTQLDALMGGDIDASSLNQLACLFYGLNLLDLLGIFNPNELQVNILAEKIESLNALIGEWRLKFSIAFTSEELKQFVSELPLAEINGLLLEIKSDFNKLPETALIFQTGESLLENTFLFMNMNAGHVLPAIVNFFDGEVFEATLRWRQIHQMNRSALGDDPIALGQNIVDHLSLLVEKSPAIINQQINFLKMFNNIEANLKGITGSFFRALACFINASELDSESELRQLKFLFATVVQHLKDLKTIENCANHVGKNSLDNKRFLESVKKEGYTLNEGLNHLSNVNDTLPNAQDSLKNFEIGLSIVSTFIKRQLLPYKALLESIANFQSTLKPSQNKKNNIWNSLVTASDFQSMFDQLFPFDQQFSTHPKWSIQCKLLKDKAKELYLEFEKTEYKKRKSFEITSKALFNQFTACTQDKADPALTQAFLMNICNRLKEDDVQKGLQMDLLHLLHQTLIDFALCSCAPFSMARALKLSQLGLKGDPKKYFILPEANRGPKDSRMLTSDKIGGAYANLFKQLEKSSNGQLIHILPGIIADIELLQKSGEIPACPIEMLDHYLNRLVVGLQMYQLFQNIKNDDEAKVLFDLRISESLEKAFNLKEIITGSFFAKVYNWLLPDSSVVFTDSNNTILKAHPQDRSKNTQLDKVSDYFRRFIFFTKYCPDDFKDLCESVRMNRDAWEEAVKKMETKETLIHSSNQDTLVQELEFLRDHVVPTYQTTLSNMNSPCAQQQWIEMLASELNNQHLSDSEKPHFKANILRMGPQIIFPWLAFSILGRRVEYVESQQSPLNLVEAIPGIDRPATLKFEVNFFQENAERKCSIQLINLNSDRDFDEFALSKIVDKVYLDIKPMFMNMPIGSSRTFEVSVIVKEFNPR